MIVRAAPDAGRTQSVALISDEPRQFEAAFRQVSRSAFLLARQLGRSTEEAQEVFDASGRQVQLSMWGITFTKPATGQITVFIPGPGRYRIQVGDALTAVELRRWIVVA